LFNWLGFRKGLPLWRSWRLNKGLANDIKQVFEGIAETRKELLTSWANDYWGHLERLKTELEATTAHAAEGTERRGPVKGVERMLASSYAKGADWTELFVLDRERKVVASTYPAHEGVAYGAESLLAAALDYSEAGGDRPCLYGPYADPMTATIGPRSSSFHDKMTLLFIYPIVRDGTSLRYLCGRVPNDVIGDLIQRESGHVYPDSGDNYIFMAQPQLNARIAPGTALSRSRFEDRTFTRGENLKDGVKTDWGLVSVKEHTELELAFTDPSTGELHEGVRNTIRNGSNLFVEFPGYSDYRHVPVIGKGVTLRLPHSPDLWGMMCEADLEEVYRIRSLSWRHWTTHVGTGVVQSAAAALLVYFVAAAASPLWTAVSLFVFCLLAGLAAAKRTGKRSVDRTVGQLRGIIRFIRMNAEGKGDLTKRLSPEKLDNDEIRELAKWINNMIDSLEGIMIQVKAAASEVLSNQQVLLGTTETTEQSTGQVAHNIRAMIGSIRSQLQDIDIAKETFDRMQATLHELERQATRQIEVLQQEVDRIGTAMNDVSVKVGETNATIREFLETTRQVNGILMAIEGISSQTHMLALNASIEAARVGEQGKGFAVVASEIRKLASLTRQSTEEVAGIIQLIQQNARQAFELMDEGTAVIEQSGKLVHEASGILSEVKAEEAKRTRTVEDVVGEVVSLMEKVAAVSKENRQISGRVEDNVQMLTGDISQVRHTSQSVEVITKELQNIVGQFRLTETRLR